ncbi:MAG: ParB/RepB/Spo0J family partition protein [Armatimonadota bacterium]
MDDSPQPLRDPARAQRPRGLGRGLGALIPGAGQQVESGVTEIAIDQIRPASRQPRAVFEDAPLAELAASIQEQGVLQPVLVRPAAEGYELVAGERRWRAARAAGLRAIPAIVRDLDDRGALEAALVENLQREDLNAIDRARAYRRLTEEFGLSQDAVARRVSRSQPSVANTLRLLALPPEVQAAVEAGRLTEGHARALLGIEPPSRLLDVWRMVEAKGLSVRETEIAAKRRIISREIPQRSRQDAAELNIIELNLSASLGAPVRIRADQKGRGEIRIAFYTADDLDRLLTALGGGTVGKP